MTPPTPEQVAEALRQFEDNPSAMEPTQRGRILAAAYREAVAASRAALAESQAKVDALVDRAERAERQYAELAKCWNDDGRMWALMDQHKQERERGEGEGK